MGNDHGRAFGMADLLYIKSYIDGDVTGFRIYSPELVWRAFCWDAYRHQLAQMWAYYFFICGNVFNMPGAIISAQEWFLAIHFLVCSCVWSLSKTGIHRWQCWCDSVLLRKIGRLLVTSVGTCNCPCVVKLSQLKYVIFLDAVVGLLTYNDVSQTNV